MQTPSHLETLFFGALELPTPAKRAEFLAANCHGDPNLEEQLTLMLAAQDRSFLTAPPDGLTPQHPSPPAEFTPPDPVDLAGRFPQLEILETIGQGGMGAVYKARQPSLDRLVALKILRPGVGHDASFAARFGREARAMARLSHPHIVVVHECGEVDDVFYLIMEYVDGVDLRRAMREGAVSPEAALDIVSQVCDALHYAHAEGIVHRDVKPENILLDRHGRVKIADFGLAKLVDSAVPTNFLSGAPLVMGTPRYMAPEQIEGSGAVDHRADIYSVGVVFYELLTGEPPMGRFPPPSMKSPVSPRLDDVVFKSLEREPQQRYQSAGAMKTDVDAARGRPANAFESRRGDAMQPTARPVVRRTRGPIVWGSAASLLTAVVISVVLAHRTPDRAGGAAAEVSGDSRRSAAANSLAAEAPFDRPADDSREMMESGPTAVAISPAELARFAGEYAAEFGASLFLKPAGDAKLAARVAPTTVRQKAPEIPATERRHVEQILSGLQRGDGSYLGKTMEPWIPQRWPGSVANELWPQQVAKHGRLKSVEFLGTDRRTLDRPSGLRPSLTVWIELIHERSRAVAMMSFDAENHQLQLLVLDVNELFCPSREADAYTAVSARTYEYGYGGPTLEFTSDDHATLHSGSVTCSFRRGSASAAESAPIHADDPPTNSDPTE